MTTLAEQLFGIEAAFTVDAVDVYEGRETPILLAREVARVELAEVGDEPVHVSETNDGFLISGDRHAVLIGPDGETTIKAADEPEVPEEEDEEDGESVEEEQLDEFALNALTNKIEAAKKQADKFLTELTKALGKDHEVVKMFRGRVYDPIFKAIQQAVMVNLKAEKAAKGSMREDTTLELDEDYGDVAVYFNVFDFFVYTGKGMPKVDERKLADMLIANGVYDAKAIPKLKAFRKAVLEALKKSKWLKLPDGWVVRDSVKESVEEVTTSTTVGGFLQAGKARPEFQPKMTDAEGGTVEFGEDSVTVMDEDGEVAYEFDLTEDPEEAILMMLDALEAEDAELDEEALEEVLFGAEDALLQASDKFFEENMEGRYTPEVGRLVKVYQTQVEAGEWKEALRTAEDIAEEMDLLEVYKRMKQAARKLMLRVRRRAKSAAKKAVNRLRRLSWKRDPSKRRQAKKWRKRNKPKIDRTRQMNAHDEDAVSDLEEKSMTMVSALRDFGFTPKEIQRVMKDGDPKDLKAMFTKGPQHLRTYARALLAVAQTGKGNLGNSHL